MDKIRKLFGIQYPIIQAGMVWASGWRLASAVSNSGGLGLLGAGSMNANLLREHICKMRKATKFPFGVNIPTFSKYAKEQIQVVLEEKVKIVFTSAGNPAEYTPLLKSNGVIVVHVVSSAKFARKAADVGVDAVVAEGFEAGGHNGRDETTTFCLIPSVRDAVEIPVIAAGGIASGKSILAAMALGADAVQIGSRFVASEEASSHINFKQMVVNANEGDTQLRLKELIPVRLLKNPFYDKVVEMEKAKTSLDKLQELLGKGRARKGMFEGDMEEGELEIGQISATINRIMPVKEIMRELIEDYQSAVEDMNIKYKSINDKI